jgi:hypothetical protein
MRRLLGAEAIELLQRTALQPETAHPLEVRARRAGTPARAKLLLRRAEQHRRGGRPIASRTVASRGERSNPPDWSTGRAERRSFRQGLASNRSAVARCSSALSGDALCGIALQESAEPRPGVVGNGTDSPRGPLRPSSTGDHGPCSAECLRRTGRCTSRAQRRVASDADPWVRPGKR